MAAPTFVKKKQLFVTGAPASAPDAVSLASASTAGNLLVLVVKTSSPDTCVTPSGWTRDLNNASDGISSGFYVFHKTSAGETTVNVTVQDELHSRTYNLLEYAGLTNPTRESVAVTNIESPTSDGVGTMPAVPYGAGPRVILGIIFMSGPGGSDVLSAVGDYTLRTPVVGTDTFKQLAVADGLKDDAGGTFASAGVFVNASAAALMCVGLVYMDSPVLIARGSLAAQYIGLDAAVTSPFSGIEQELDAIFAINLTEEALPSALLYGPDLATPLATGGGVPAGAGLFWDGDSWEPAYAPEPLILEDGTIAILEDGSAAMSEPVFI